MNQRFHTDVLPNSLQGKKLSGDRTPDSLAVQLLSQLSYWFVAITLVHSRQGEHSLIELLNTKIRVNGIATN